MNLGENIYRFRIQKNMSQGDLADALNVSRQSVSKWENNSATPELEKLIKMSQLFGVTLDELVTCTNASVPNHNAVPNISTPPRKIVGALLLLAAFLTFLILTAVAGIAIGVIYAIPFALCGIVCFAFNCHTGVWCAWALYLPLVLITNPDYFRADIGAVARIFVQIPILLYTVLDFRKDVLLLTHRTKTLLISGYVLWLLYIGIKLACRFTLNAGLTLNFWIDYFAFPLFCALLTATLRILKGAQ